MAEHADEPATRRPATSMHSGVGPNGHSYVLAINEYCQRHFRTDVRYVFARCESDFTATAVLDGLTYSTGRDVNKHVAKVLAAKSTAEVLLPEMRDVVADSRLPDAYKLAILDNVDLADERTPEITLRYDVVRPYNLLLRCLDRNFGYKASDIKLTTHRAEAEYCRAHMSLTVGSYSVSVPATCRAKQEAAQAILMNVHPHLESWGSLVRMYVVNKARTFEEMTTLAGIQHNLVMLALDGDVDDGVPTGEDKGEPRTPCRGQDDETEEESGDDSEEDDEDGDGDDEDDDDEDDEESESESDEARAHTCRDRCVVVDLGDLTEDDDELDDEDPEEEGAGPEQQANGAKTGRDSNLNLRGEEPESHNLSYCGRLSFGDLPTIGDDFEAALLEPLRTAARTPSSASSASSEAPQPVGAQHGDAASASGHDADADATGHRRRRGHRAAGWYPGEWAVDVEQGLLERGREVQDGPPLMWCDMPSSFADIFKDWPYRHHSDPEGPPGLQEQPGQQGQVVTALFGLEMEKGGVGDGK